MTAQNWHELRKTIKLNGKHWINGKSVDSVDSSIIEKQTPIDGTHLLSLVAPQEWGGSGPYKQFLAAVQLLADHTWKEILS